MKPLITALVDTYNHERYIEQALVSALEQGFSPAELEIVVVDDGSTDNTASIIQKFEPRVRHIRKKNGGQASAFNAGFAETSGEIVALLDGDDWWAEGKLAAVLKAFDQHPEAAAVSHAYYQFNEGAEEAKLFGPEKEILLNLATPDAAHAALSAWAFLQTSALSVRRRLLEAVMPIPEVLVFSADSPIAITAMAMGALVLPQPLSYYRFHSSNLYAVGADREKLRRKSEIDEAMYEVLYPLLFRLGVSSASASALLEQGAIEASRFRLRTFGGPRRKTFQTEMRVFHSDFKKPSIGYLLFKYLVMGGATLLLPPQRFYQMRDWYARHNLGRFRGWFVRGGVELGGRLPEADKGLPSRVK